MGDPVQHGVRRSVAEGVLRGGGCEGREAEGEQVGGRGDLAAHRLLGGHVAGRAHPGPGAGQRGGVGGVRDAEVDDDRAVARQHHVPRLEVPVDHPGRVDVGQGRGHPGDEPQHRVRVETAVGRVQRLGQGGAADVLGGQPGHGPVGVAVHHRRDITAPHPPCRAHLLLEPSAEARLPGQVRVHHLQRDGPAAPRL